MIRRESFKAKTLHSLYGFEPIPLWSYEIRNYNIEKFYLRNLDFKRDRW